MNPIVTFSFLILACVSVIVAYIFRLCRQRTVSSVFELIAAGAFVVGTVENAVLFTSKNLDFIDASKLVLFIFAVLVAIYKVITFTRFHK